MNLSLLLGFAAGAMLIVWVAGMSNLNFSFFDMHGIVMVVGGLVTAMMINCSFTDLGSAIKRFLTLFLPSKFHSIDLSIAEVVKLAQKAHREGGILAVQGDSRDFADGFLHRAIVVAITSGESDETRRVMEAEIRNLRVSRTEDSNIYRTAGILAPMFGLLGTLLGMLKVLQEMSDPTKAASSMALALSSAFLGIMIANFFCVPVAGRIRLRAHQESLALEVILEGVLDIAAGKAPYLVQLHLASYSAQRRTEIEASESGARVPTGAAT